MRLIQRCARKVCNLRRIHNYVKKEENRNGRGPLFSHVTYYWVGNAGDTVLSKCVRKTMDELQGLHRWKLIPVNKKVTKVTIENINSSSALILGGGGSFPSRYQS